MKSSFIITLIIILIITLAVSGSACKADVPVEESVSGTTDVSTSDEEKEQTVEAIEKETEQSMEADEGSESAEGEEMLPEAEVSTSYIVKFNATWSSDSHPDNYTANAHFSPFVAYSYNGTDQGRVFKEGIIASPGMEEMAETGATGILEEEISRIIDENSALNYVKANRIDSPGETEITLEFNQDFSQFIFVSMIAPSPDWFVAGEGNLFVDGQWVDQIVLDVISFDAGTDSGNSFTAADSDTDPKQPVNRLDESFQKFGVITITKI
jgi:hypothetical protein